MAKELSNHKITLVGLLCSFIFGLVIGGVVYLLIKTFNLKSRLWYILFMFLPPVIGFVIYWRSKAKVV
jgi:fructose-specific phosphotransferase system IIC component